MDSFSSKIKKELSNINNLSNKTLVKAELDGYLLTTSSNKFITENQYNINRFSKLLNNCNENNYKIEMQGKNFCITYPKGKIKIEDKKRGEEEKRALVRGAFMSSGSVTNPKNKYHLEIVFEKEENAKIIKDVLLEENIEVKILKREKNFILYIKDGENISKFLAYIGANKSVLEFEDERVIRDMRNQVNRLVNCETANLNKTISSSVKQIENIKLIKAKKKFDKLTPKEQELANIRLENPDASLSELGKLLKNPISKSGVNHRLEGINSLAEELRKNKVNKESNK